MKKKVVRKYECLGGPLCGRYEEPLPKIEGLGCVSFVYTDDEINDGVEHGYRLARSGGKRYWHYLGKGPVHFSAKIKMRPLSQAD